MTTQFCKLVGIDYPIVAFTHCRDVVAAVSKAGGIGVLGAAKFTPEQLEIELNWIDAHVDGRPYGVDVLAPSLSPATEDADLTALEHSIPKEHREFVAQIEERLRIPPETDGPTPQEFSGIIVSRATLDAHVRLALSHPIKFLVSALGPFSPEIMAQAKNQGVLIGGMCGSVKHARLHAAAGADVIIAQGSEAGGHTGEISTLVLTPQVVDAVAPIPVLAAGGIATGRQLAAVLALGAQGAWTGSLWLTVHESDTDPRMIDKLLAADSAQTVRTKSVTGKPVRMLHTPLEQVWLEEGAPPTLPAPQQGMLMRPLYHRVYQNGVKTLMSHAVGQAVGLLNARRPCKAVLDEMMREVVDTMERVNGEIDLNS
ncbi:FMN-dependent enoyl-acyl-carrier-protein [alpha proteobacterium U9-1i]|nr:FMN-dependent enoyl-acyl-carrier-protein [alpha proteobacterium U9-1i]